MKKILITKFPFASRFGGGEKHTLDIVTALFPKGYQVHLLSSCGVLLQEFRRRKIPAVRMWFGVEPVTAGALFLFIFTAIPIAVLLGIMLVLYRLRGIRILYCLSLTEKVLVPWFARMLGMRVIFMEHRLIDRWLTHSPLRFLYALQSRASTVVAVSQALAKQLGSIGVPASRIEVISPGVDVRLFPWPRQRGVNHGAFIVGTVAGLEPGKGVAHLLHALSQARTHIPTLRALVVGSGPERQQLQWLSQQLGLKEQVQWVGFQRDAYRWYNHFDVFVLPSIKPESFGIVVIEAMAAGVPVIATKLGAVPEIIMNGVTGYLVPPGDAHTLSEKLLWLYYHREEIPRITEKARNLVENQYRHDAMIRRFIKLFEQQV